MRLKGLVTLKKRSEFSHVRLCGRSFCSGGLLVQAVGAGVGRQDLRLLRVGFTVSKRTGNAVVRNRVKRRLRVAAEDVLPQNANREFCYVLVGSKKLSTVHLVDIRSSLVVCLKRLGLYR
ncbi:MAG: ribonuclease P protein component [Aaplasma endosymbiont of Hyalomma asiaticum]